MNRVGQFAVIVFALAVSACAFKPPAVPIYAAGAPLASSERCQSLDDRSTFLTATGVGAGLLASGAGFGGIAAKDDGQRVGFAVGAAIAGGLAAALAAATKSTAGAYVSEGCGAVQIAATPQK